MDQKKIAKTLASFAPAYQNAILKLDPNFEEQFENTSDGNYHALEFFLDHFAYERQGSPKAYREIAKQTLEETFHKRLETIDFDVSKDAWQNYERIAGTLRIKGTNKKRNPMNCNNGVLTIMTVKGVINIANNVKCLISEGKVKTAHEFIDSIKGIGTKIASFYLRDITYLKGLEKKQLSDQSLLQPIDTWLEQTYIMMTGEKTKNLAKKQNFFVDICWEAECSPIEFNQGAWFAGSQIAGERSKFENIALGDTKIVEDYVKKQRHYFSEIEKALDKNVK